MAHLWGLMMLDKLLKFRLLLLLLLLLLTSCASNVVVQDQFPPPLVEQSPLTVILDYSDEFRQYSYIETGEKRSLQSVDMGTAQVNLFNTVFAKMFNLIEQVETVEGTTSVPADLKITPEILDFQYTLPRETKANVYEVWLKYRIQIRDNNNEIIDDWVVKGYGKTPTATLRSATKAFDTATNIALRDVGAQLAIGFKRQASIKDYLEQRGGVKL